MRGSIDHARISQAIRAAEQTTSGEIFCVLARSSDGYFHPAASVLSGAILLASLLVALWLETTWYDIGASTMVIAQMLALAAGLLILKFAPSLRIRLVPKRVRYAKAHANAVRQFLSRNVHTTKARTGVLIFVSLEERYAEIVADSGINEKVAQAEWNRIVADLVGAASDGRLTEGFERAVGASGALLASHFPPRRHDRNELDDRLVEI
jgi:putative membrane protein